MFEISNDPAEAKEQIRLSNFIDSRRNKINRLSGSGFGGSSVKHLRESIETTTKALREELALWEAILEQKVD